MNNHSVISEDQGFTILELMIATMVFAVLLLGGTIAMIQIGKLYYRNITTSKTQDITRSIMDDISRQVQFGGDKITISSPTTYTTTAPDHMSVQAICIGSIRYSYVLNSQLSDSVGSGQYFYSSNDHRARHVLWRDTISTGAACTPLNIADDTITSTSVDGTELLGANMRLKKLDLANSCTSTTLCNISVAVIYGADDLISFSDGAAQNQPNTCLSVSGGQWCARAELSSTVFKRLRAIQ